MPSSMWISWIQKNVRTPESVKIGPGEKSPGKSPRNKFWIDSTSFCTSISEKLKSGRKTGAFFAADHLPFFYFWGIAPAFSLIHIPGALPQLFHSSIFLGHCPSFFTRPYFWCIAPAFSPIWCTISQRISGAIQLMPKNLKF